MSDAQQEGKFEVSRTIPRPTQVIAAYFVYFSFLMFRDFQKSITFTGRSQGFARW
jgi:hypothetical protein